MKILTSVFLVCMGLVTSLWAASGEKEKERVKASGHVLKEILDAPDKGVPISVLDRAKCVIVIPGEKKGAFIVGASYGRGAMTCRTGEGFKGPWSAPIMMATQSGSLGFQIGGEGIDVVILVLNDDGARSLMKSKVKLGADASVAAGPVGRTAEASTNEIMKAQMLSYSRSRGAFAGVSLAGATLHVDGDADEHLYGEKISAEQILKGEGITMPEEAKAMVETLTHASEKAATHK